MVSVHKRCQFILLHPTKRNHELTPIFPASLSGPARAARRSTIRALAAASAFLSRAAAHRSRRLPSVVRVTPPEGSRKIQLTSSGCASGRVASPDNSSGLALPRGMMSGPSASVSPDCSDFSTSVATGSEAAWPRMTKLRAAIHLTFGPDNFFAASWSSKPPRSGILSPASSLLSNLNAALESRAPALAMSSLYFSFNFFVSTPDS